ncbi:prephenate dehydratase [Aeromonas schubertii]|uniref:Bifunctional chorismate mutase/prephenate dehydratase n=1 Tax=Aeromonas schubertii TaxID=652 RepID=A0A0S2SG59_9GAMM|nr:prephenate dehydratase [Aeromonas schubertii]ALP40703.1 Chorismate mutase/prephenate dehydratase [Aeromonas schubertii]KUE80158.1 bifunctional chorismate mutase/prephenate dehydratase [Aeromonas schubertii]MBZ6067735.1 prephenate dehydratase [Aeromonas schubertii]MBZ6071051.1 prephenate dehydratase [Aeromonas schubertii]QCG47400.1 prephenate dehydratase [Aeromonas schubertii]
MALLEHIREEITQLDTELLALLARRKSLSIEVAKAKQANPRPIRDHQREQDLLVNLIQKGRPLGLDAQYVTRIYHTIIEDSVLSQQAYLQGLLNPGQQEPMTSVAYLGPRGSYSSLAARRYLARYKDQVIEVNCHNFREVIDAVESGQAAYGVLPIENTSSGSINEVYDVMQHTNLSIVGELTYPIEHCILTAVATDLTRIKTLYAHPQVFQQCSHYLGKLEGVRHEICDSSSSAMMKVRELASPEAAAIGSAAGGELYGLEVLATHLANQKENYSRFIVVARKPIEVAPQIPAKTTLIMSTSQQAGSLVEALLVLRSHQINMTKLESRPVQGNPWEEMFYLDVSANLQTPQMQAALVELTKITRHIKVLGCYPSEDVKPTDVPPVLLG